MKTSTVLLVLLVLTTATPVLADWETEYVLTVGHLHRLTYGQVERGSSDHGGITLPRSSFHPHRFLKAEVSMYRIDHGYDEPVFQSHVFNYHSKGLPHLSRDFVHDVRLVIPPETRVIDWSIY